jgi:hypothetical protein
MVGPMKHMSRGRVSGNLVAVVAGSTIMALAFYGATSGKDPTMPLVLGLVLIVWGLVGRWQDEMQSDDPRRNLISYLRWRLRKR